MATLFDHAFPQPLWSSSGNTWGRQRLRRRRKKEEEEEDNEEETSAELLGSFLGPPGSFLGASWRSLGRLLGPLGSSWGLLRGLFGCLRAFVSRLTPSEAVLWASLGHVSERLELSDWPEEEKEGEEEETEEEEEEGDKKCVSRVPARGKCLRDPAKLNGARGPPPPPGPPPPKLWL